MTTKEMENLREGDEVTVRFGGVLLDGHVVGDPYMHDGELVVDVALTGGGFLESIPAWKLS